MNIRKIFHDIQSELGRKGGKARAAGMTPEQRQAAAKEASQARWGAKSARKQK